MNWPKDNGEGCDDRLWLPVFENWLHDLDNSTNTNAKSPKEERSSFFTQIYSFNVHYVSSMFMCSSEASPFFAFFSLFYISLQNTILCLYTHSLSHTHFQYNCFSSFYFYSRTSRILRMRPNHIDTTIQC